MMERLMGMLIILSGGVLFGVGIAMASRHVRQAGRVRARTAARSASAVDGWSDWFLAGFLEVATGVRWLSAADAGSLLAATGLGLIGFGAQVSRWF